MINKKLEIKADKRGRLIEIFKIAGFGQVYYVTVEPGFVRGNHYHGRKKEKFCVIEGNAKINLKNREGSELKEIFVAGENPELIDIPPNWTHNVENIGQGQVKLLAWSSEVYNPNDPDTYPEKL